jgi:hypothetical protein
MSGAGLATMTAFAAAAVVWLAARGLVGRATVPLLASFIVASALATFAVLSDGSMQLAGVATVGAATLVVVSGERTRLSDLRRSVLRRRSAK